MTVLTFPGRDYAADLRMLADQARRNTHIVVARHRQTGEARSWHARPRREAVEYRDNLRHVLGDQWVVKAVRRRKTTAPAWRG
ncbi:hypothetical protein GCM10010399_43910 [Dactylosporangium fulvum]|uniref:Uncharacterized protein n=1 Tax=Dactylosporangium fulvum TaxID=53359 RepID=A0ABY5W770_9ACTN|nr:hypothetical protein [Dactylosporangium fulvum]UWP85942.1 hypothetical protein Dfulv_17485 [Dactylosporangium fulvum]